MKRIFNGRSVSRKRISAIVMPHGGGVIRAYRDGRIVERGQQIAPYVFDLRGGFPEGVHHIGNVFKVQPSVSLLDFRCRYLFIPDLDTFRSAAQNVTNELQDTVRVIVGIALGQAGVVDLLPHVRFDHRSLYFRAVR